MKPLTKRAIYEINRAQQRDYSLVRYLDEINGKERGRNKERGIGGRIRAFGRVVEIGRQRGRKTSFQGRGKKKTNRLYLPIYFYVVYLPVLLGHQSSANTQQALSKPSGNSSQPKFISFNLGIQITQEVERYLNFYLTKILFMVALVETARMINFLFYF